MTLDDRPLTCAGARQELLVAEPEEMRSVLRAGSSAPTAEGRSTPLGRHLTGCSRCRAAATAILEAEAALDAHLGRRGTPPHVAGIVAAAEAMGRAAPGSSAGAPRAGRDEASATTFPGGRAWRARWTVSAALAAGLAALLLVRNGPPATPGPTRAEVRTALSGDRTPAGADDLDLEIPPGTDAAVFTTADPDIKVIWFMGGDR